MKSGEGMRMLGCSPKFNYSDGYCGLSSSKRPGTYGPGCWVQKSITAFALKPHFLYFPCKQRCTAGILRRAGALETSAAG